jgi:predicted PolB exonuclease-like 3'-5' exonuclease
MSTWLAFDCETLAVPDAADWIKPGSAPENYKDPAKIAAYIEEQRQSRIAKAATDVDLARVLTVSVLSSSGGGVTTHEAWTVRGEYDEAVEASVVSLALSHLASVDVAVGFNLDFDVCLLLRRAQLLQIADAPTLEMRYRERWLVQPETGYRTRLIDLMDVLTWNGAVNTKSLDWYARRFGCPVQDACDGSQIAGLYAARELDAIVSHCEADVRRTAWLAQRIGVVKAQPTLHAVGA